MVSGVRLSRIASGVYAVNSGMHVLVIEKAKFVLRRMGKFKDHWLRYLVGVLSTTLERIWVCLGPASRADKESWIQTSNGTGMMLALRLLDHMLRKLGIAKCIAIAYAALEHG